MTNNNSFFKQNKNHSNFNNTKYNANSTNVFYNKKDSTSLSTIIPLDRLYIILGFFVICIITIIFKLFDLTLSNIEELNTIIAQNNKTTSKISRYNILDRNGLILATNIPTASLYAHPNQILDPENAAHEISKVFSDASENDLLKKLSSNKSFIWIKRHITPNIQQKIHNLGIPGIYFVKDEKRFYPHANLCSHVVGYVNVDGYGMGGIERAYNSILNHENDIQLSMDIRVQYIVHEELKKAIEMHNAASGVVIVMNPHNGEVIAMVSLPDFDPNYITEKDKEKVFNYAVLGVQEMGSTFKALTLAIGLDTGKINLNDSFNVSNAIKLGGFTIHDYKGKGGYLAVPEILMYSSNLGIAQISRKIGLYHQKEYLRKIGALNVLDFELPERGRPLYPNDNRWNDISLVTIGYGHGIAITPLHTIQIISTIVNGGVIHKPTIIKTNKTLHNDQNNDLNHYINNMDTANINDTNYIEQITNKLTDNKEVIRVFKPETSDIMKKLLRLTVSRGNGKKANIDDYIVGGKTGTSEKIINGKYVKNLNDTLFFGAFPINNPEYVIFLAINEPKPNKINMGYTTGGMIAAPVAGEIIKKIGNILSVQYQDSKDYKLQKEMFVNYQPQFKNTIFDTMPEEPKKYE